MDFNGWLNQNWFNLFQTVGIVGSLWYAARSYRFDAKIRRVGNLIEIIDHHRRIWSQLYHQPNLTRIREENLDLRKSPITVEEDLFVSQVILHLRGVFRASQEGVIAPMEGAEADVRQFFSKPIPQEVWRRQRRFQDLDFIEFVESQLG